MKFFKRTNRSKLFVLDEDGIGITLHRDGGGTNAEEAFEEYSREGVVHGRRFLGLTLPRTRFTFALFLLFSVCFLFFGRAAQLQIMEGEHYQALAEGNRIRIATIIPPRGLVFDKNGEQLVGNGPSFVLTMTIADIPDDAEERNRVITRIAELIGWQRTDIDLLITDFSDSPTDPVVLKKGIPYESALSIAIQTADLPGFELETSTIREYAIGASSLSHILGYVGKITQEEYAIWKEKGYRRVDEIGKVGIERGLEELLRGIPGRRVTEVDALGNELSILSEQSPIPGANITLSIDAEMQEYIQKRLQALFERIGASRGSVVVVDTKSGGIRAMVGLPSYESNSFAAGIDTESYQRLIEDEDRPLFPRAYAGEFPSGSTFKPFVGYAALREGIITERTSFLSTGGIGVGPWFFPDWRYGGHGYTDIRKAIAESVNTFFYIIGGGYKDVTGLGVDRLTAYASLFGFGAPTGIPLPGEADGFLPSRSWKQEAKNERWYVGDTYNLSIGQGDLLVTPLQLALATGMIANGGDYLAPRLIEAVDGGPPVDLSDAKRDAAEQFDPYAIQVIREGMRMTVTKGSARSLSTIEMDIAGKTGTAQNIGDRPTHAWFTGFAPYKDPEIAIVVLIEEGGEGSSVAVPLAREIFEWWQFQR